MQELIKKYTERGVLQNKIIVTKQPSVVIWSTSRKCIVGGDTGIEAMEIIEDHDGNKRLSVENNSLVSLQIRTELTVEDVEEINSSEGIVCTDALYGKVGFRYGFIPSSKSLTNTNKRVYVMTLSWPNFNRELIGVCSEEQVLDRLSEVVSDKGIKPELIQAAKDRLAETGRTFVDYLVRGYNHQVKFEPIKLDDRLLEFDTSN